MTSIKSRNVRYIDRLVKIQLLRARISAWTQKEIWGAEGEFYAYRWILSHTSWSFVYIDQTSRYLPGWLHRAGGKRPDFVVQSTDVRAIKNDEFMLIDVKHHNLLKGQFSISEAELASLSATRQAMESMNVGIDLTVAFMVLPRGERLHRLCFINLEDIKAANPTNENGEPSRTIDLNDCAVIWVNRKPRLKRRSISKTLGK